MEKNRWLACRHVRLVSDVSEKVERAAGTRQSSSKISHGEPSPHHYSRITHARRSRGQEQEERRQDTSSVYTARAVVGLPRGSLRGPESCARIISRVWSAARPSRPPTKTLAIHNSSNPVIVCPRAASQAPIASLTERNGPLRAPRDTCDRRFFLLTC